MNRDNYRLAAPSSGPLFSATKEEDHNSIIHYSTTPTSSTAQTTAPQKKRRNLPGTPYPDAEVIALSPKTLMATNRFICEVCNKGFQREQNLQLHRRGHNLPWKLKQKTTKDVKRKVYLCPEPSCVHHDPSRALGDLTGIKKHYSRKHGEKKWKCDKCSKRYAVQSDWKAHAKTCGTREYRCDCGTLFSRRDSFITHRAFCDALAQESARRPTALDPHLYGNSNRTALGLSQLSSQLSPLRHQNHLMASNILGPQSIFAVDSNRASEEHHQAQHGMLLNKPLHGLLQLPDLQSNPNNSSPATNIFNLGYFSNSSTTSSITNSENGNGSNPKLSNSGFLLGQEHFNNGNSDINNVHLGPSLSSIFNNSAQLETASPHMSATALLQKAAQIGSTASGDNGSALLRTFGNQGSSTIRSQMEQNENNQLQGLMSSLANGSSSSIFGNGQDEQAISFGGFINHGLSFGNMEEEKLNHNVGLNVGGSDRLTLDFLGVGGKMVRNISRIGMSSLDSELKSAQASLSFGGARPQ